MEGIFAGGFLVGAGSNASYTEGIGMSFNWGVFGKDWEYRWQITAYINGGDTVGTFSPEIDWALGLDAANPQLALTIYPVPTTDKIQISGLKNGLGASWEITGVSGLRLAGGSLHDNQIDVSFLNSGLYFLTVSTPDKGNAVMKFLKK